MSAAHKARSARSKFKAASGRVDADVAEGLKQLADAVTELAERVESVEREVRWLRSQL